MKKILFCMILLILIITGCRQKITREQAERTAIDFVNQKVRFTARGVDNESPNVLLHQANNQITRIFEENEAWNVEIFVESNVDGQSKKGLFVVVVDIYSGEVKNLIQQKIA